MMKVLLLGFGKIAYMPYMNFYLDTLKERDIQFELIYWDRDGKPDEEVHRGFQRHISSRSIWKSSFRSRKN